MGIIHNALFDSHSNKIFLGMGTYSRWLFFYFCHVTQDTNFEDIFYSNV